jgi:hypothetical protein
MGLDIVNIVKSKAAENILYKQSLLELWNENMIIPSVNQGGEEIDWKMLSKRLRELLGALLVHSAKEKALDTDQYLLFRIKYFLDFVEEDSEKVVCGLSLLCHCCRVRSWESLRYAIDNIYAIQSVPIDRNFNDFVNQALELLCDDRILNILESIADLRSDQIREILTKRKFVLHLVDVNVSMSAWVTPVGIALNLSKMTDVEKGHLFGLAKILGHELAHYLGRVNYNFELSTPEKVRMYPDSSIQKLLEKRTFYSSKIDEHLESGLLFELALVGEKFNYENEYGRNIADYLLELLSDPTSTLPLIFDAKATNIPRCPIMKYDEEFAFCSIREFDHAM